MSYELLILIVVVNAVFTASLWRRASQAVPRPKKKFAKSLWDSAPINPKHEPPKPASFPYDWDRRFFFDFADFADVVNWWLADEHVGSRWRLQELPETLIALSDHGPDFGRTYAAFFNQQRVGTVQIYAGFKYGGETQQVRTHIELNWVRLLGYEAVAEFLACIQMHVTDHNPKRDEYRQARQSIQDAMLKVLWEDYRISEFTDNGQSWGELSLDFHGTPSWYFGRKNASGFSEFKRAAR